MRFFIFLKYKGTNYHGWQIQPNAITIQEILQTSISKLLGHQTEVIGAGRTDTGVHASYFVAHFDTCRMIDPVKLCSTLDRIVPRDISIDQIRPVRDGAHSRFSALSRTYKYFITRKKDPFLQETATHVWGPLDVPLMNEACALLFCYEDFTSFSKLHTDTATNNCRIYEAHWQEEGNILVFTIRADRFLRNMVRAIVGTLLEVGKGNITLDDFRNIIEAKNRCSAGMSAPAQGLFLVGIEYDNGILCD